MEITLSSLQAIDQSISHTQQLLNQSQRLTRDINRIDQAFRRSYPKSYPVSTSSKQLIGDAQRRWQNSLAACQDALRVETAWCRHLRPRGRKRMGLSHRASPRSASFRRARPATS